MQSLEIEDPSLLSIFAFDLHFSLLKTLLSHFLSPSEAISKIPCHNPHVVNLYLSHFLHPHFPIFCDPRYPCALHHNHIPQ